MCVGGRHSISLTHAQSWQSIRATWTNEHFLHKCALALGHSIEHSTTITYTSHLQSYLSFCKLHDCPSAPPLTPSLSMWCSCLTILTLTPFLPISLASATPSNLTS